MLFLFSEYAFVFWELELGTGGLAKGLGGPEAPALRTALADGDGGGSTIPE